MTRPGDRLRAIAARLCSAATMERLIDPAVADLQTEYEEARRRGRKWDSCRVWLAGHFAFFKAVVVYGSSQATGLLHDWTAADRRSASRTLALCAAIIALGTLLMMMPPILERQAAVGVVNVLRLIPQGLALAIPFGLVLGLIWGLGGGASSLRLRAMVIVIGLASSIAAFANVAWVLPAANQSFRIAVAGPPPVAKGPAEMTIGELRQAVRTGPVSMPFGSRSYRSMAMHYHQRWALAGAPFVLSFFALVLIGRSRRRSALALAGCAATVGYYALLFAGRAAVHSDAVSPFAGAWAANGAFLLLASAMLMATTLRPATRRL